MAESEKIVLSEDPNAGLATPVMDLIAAGVFAAIALWIGIESLRLSVPAEFFTAPGLLPFLTAGSLLIMAILLAASAIRRRRAGVAEGPAIELPADFRRSMVLGGILVVYIAALQYLPVAYAFPLGPFHMRIGNFEVATVLVLTAILFVFWRPVLWIGLAIAFGWTTFLSLVFRLIFELRLP
jgi:Tripartite tricarboxylate transporter TctB family